MSEIEHITTEKAVETYEATREVFDALLKEIRELSKKKPELKLADGKANIINRVLRELMTILKEGPQGKFLDQFDTHSQPQVSDALLLMVQFEVALDAFSERYDSDDGWVTPRLLEELKAECMEHEDEGNEDEESEDDDWDDDEWEDEDDQDDDDKQ